MINNEQKNTSNNLSAAVAGKETQTQADFFKSVIEMVPGLVTIVEIPSQTVLYTNKDSMELLGFNHDEILQLSAEQRQLLSHPEDATALETFYASFGQLEDDEVNMVEYRLHHKTGRWVTLCLRGKVFSRDERGKVDKALIFSEDVTGYHLVKLRFKQAQQQQHSSLFNAAITAQEVERERISESLHNGLGQLLYGVKLSFNHLFSDKVLQQPEAFEKEKNYTDALLTNAIDETRRISHELVPKILKDAGLKAAILNVCQQMGEGVKLECNLWGLNQKLNDNLEIALYRIIQELLLNVARHANATTALLKFKITHKKISIEVKDNGKGFDANQKSKSGIGLSGIRHKIQLLNGSLKIGAVQGGGTSVGISIPYIT